jgi:hypothetical protein
MKYDQAHIEATVLVFDVQLRWVSVLQQQHRTVPISVKEWFGIAEKEGIRIQVDQSINGRIGCEYVQQRRCGQRVIVLQQAPGLTDGCEVRIAHLQIG